MNTNYSEHVIEMYERHQCVARQPQSRHWAIYALLQGFAYAAVLCAVLGLLAFVLGDIYSALTVASILLALWMVIYG